MLYFSRSNVQGNLLGIASDQNVEINTLNKINWITLFTLKPKPNQINKQNKLHKPPKQTKNKPKQKTNQPTNKTNEDPQTSCQQKLAGFSVEWIQIYVSKIHWITSSYKSKLTTDGSWAMCDPYTEILSFCFIYLGTWVTFTVREPEINKVLKSCKSESALRQLFCLSGFLKMIMCGKENNLHWPYWVNIRVYQGYLVTFF